MKKTVVLIGDSIRLGYEARVRELLGDEVQVFSPGENCRYSKYLLWGMRGWMNAFGTQTPDLIHYNAGIWDLHRCTADNEVFTPLDEYLACNRRIAIQMESYTKNIIWATTIPGGPALNNDMPINALINTDPNAPRLKLVDHQEPWNADVVRYNKACREMLEARGIAIDDLYSVVAGHEAEYICNEDGIHPSPAGYEALARQVAKCIKEHL